MFSPVRPLIIPAPPQLANPTPRTSTLTLTSGSQPRSNVTAEKLSLLYKMKAGTNLEGWGASDHKLTECSGLFRAYGGSNIDCTIERVEARLAPYKAGLTASLYQSANTETRGLVIRDCFFDGSTPITNPSDIYGAVDLGGKTADDIGSDILFENVVVQNLWAEYDPQQYPGKYPNRDGFVIEQGYVNGNARWCEARHVSDAGFDLKALGWRRDFFVGEDCRETLKTWVNTEDGAIFSIHPRVAHFSVMRGAEHTIEFAALYSVDPKVPIAKFENAPGILRILNADTHGLPAGQILAAREPSAIGSKIIINGVETVI